MSTRLAEKAKKFPLSPGVYTFRDAKGKPLYIGRAGILRRRVAQYFQKDREPRIAEMVASAKNITFETTNSVLEAIILEANLIKKYWPKYNVKDRDNRSFVYLVILKGEYPKPVIVRGRDIEKYRPKGLEIFGPYQSFYLLRTALELTRKIFPYSTCQPMEMLKTNIRKSDFRILEKPCFHYQIGLCPGVCIGAVTPKEYKRYIDKLILFFKGDNKRLIAKLKKDNPEKIEALKHVEDTALLTRNGMNTSLIDGRVEGYDISHHGGTEAVGAMVVFEGGEKDVSQYRLFKIRGATSSVIASDSASESRGKLEIASSKTRNDRSSPDAKSGQVDRTRTIKSHNDLAMLKEVLVRRLKHTEWPYPDVIFVDGGITQVRTIIGVLREHRLFIPVAGISKAGQHSGSAHAQNKLIIGNVKKQGQQLFIGSKPFFQKVRDETHRFVIGFGRKRQHKSLFKR